MSTAHTLPPYRQISAPRPLSTAEVLENIQSYLDASATQAHLHPDCMFSERCGPMFASAAGTGGLVLQQLRRVEAGLKGVWMGVVDPQFDFRKGLEEAKGGSKGALATVGGAQEGFTGQHLREGDDTRLDLEIARTQGVAEATGNVQRGVKRKARFAAEDSLVENGDAEDGEGEDVANYQEQLRDQGERSLVDEIGERSNVVGNVEKAPRILSTVAASRGTKRKPEDSGMGGVKHGQLDRKAAKKLKNKERKALKEQERLEAQQQRGNEQNDAHVEVANEVDTIGGASVQDKSQDDKARRKAEKHARKLARAQRRLEAT